MVTSVCCCAGGQATAGGARRLLNAGSSLDGSGKNAPDGVSSPLSAYCAPCNHLRQLLRMCTPVPQLHTSYDHVPGYDELVGGIVVVDLQSYKLMQEHRLQAFRRRHAVSQLRRQQRGMPFCHHQRHRQLQGTDLQRRRKLFVHPRFWLKCKLAIFGSMARLLLKPAILASCTTSELTLDTDCKFSHNSVV